MSIAREPAMSRRSKAQSIHAADDHADNAARLADAIGVAFHDLDLLRLALTHRSVAHELRAQGPHMELPPSLRSNERLEFLGDAVLGYLVADDLYRRFPDAPEGDLTSRRVALVRAERLVSWARSINLGDYVYLATGERVSDSDRDRILSGGFEALIGAITLDQGVAATAAFMQPFLDADAAGSLEEWVAANPKGQLQEYVQEHYRQPPIYRIIDAEGPDHARIFTAEVLIDETVIGSGSGESKRLAEQAAAAEALDQLRQPRAPKAGRPTVRKRRKPRAPKGGTELDG
jgi:ribonuclease-3